MIVSRLLVGKRPGRRGAAAVEFALVAPFFFLLIFGIVEFGRALMVQQVLVNAARAGARTAILTGSTDANVTTAISNYMTPAGISGYTTTITPDLGTTPPPGTGTSITIKVSVPWSSVTWSSFYPSDWFKGQTIAASVVMVHE